jgi:hypothetical protein
MKLKSLVPKVLLEAIQIKYKQPNFDYEWDEATRYPEFMEMGYDNWMAVAKEGYVTDYNSIKGMLGNVDLNLSNLEQEKVQRVMTQLQTGSVETPIVVKFNHNDYDLLAGNTRLATIVKGGGNPKLWVVDISNDTQLSPKELDISPEMDEKQKYSAWNFSDAEYYTGMQGKR